MKYNMNPCASNSKAFYWHMSNCHTIYYLCCFRSHRCHWSAWV